MLKKSDHILYSFFLFSFAISHFLVDPPLRTLLWDQSLFRMSGDRWNFYLDYIATSSNIAVFSYMVSFGFLVSAVAEFFQKRIFLSRELCFIYLAVFAFALFKDKNYLFPILIEHSGKWAIAAIFLFPKMRYHFFMKLAIALTFIGHGLLACGAFPVPGHFLDMTLELTPMNYDQSLKFLFYIGIIDIIFALGLFNKKTELVSLIYCITWGFVTALARPMFILSIGQLDQFVVLGLVGFLSRIPHFWIGYMILREKWDNSWTIRPALVQPQT